MSQHLRNCDTQKIRFPCSDKNLFLRNFKDLQRSTNFTIPFQLLMWRTFATDIQHYPIHLGVGSMGRCYELWVNNIYDLTINFWISAKRNKDVREAIQGMGSEESGVCGTVRLSGVKGITGRDLSRLFPCLAWSSSAHGFSVSFGISLPLTSLPSLDQATCRF